MPTNPSKKKTSKRRASKLKIGAPVTLNRFRQLTPNEVADFMSETEPVARVVDRFAIEARLDAIRESLDAQAVALEAMEERLCELAAGFDDSRDNESGDWSTFAACTFDEACERIDDALDILGSSEAGPSGRLPLNLSPRERAVFAVLSGWKGGK